MHVFAQDIRLFHKVPPGQLYGRFVHVCPTGDSNIRFVDKDFSILRRNIVDIKVASVPIFGVLLTYEVANIRNP